MEKQAIDLDPFDLEGFEDGLRVSKKLSDKVEEEKDRLVTVRELAADLWSALFKYNPRLRELEDMDPSFHVNHKLAGEGMDLPEYERLRLYTRLKETESTAATEVILSKVVEALSDEDLQAIQKCKEASDAYQKALERAQALQEFLEQNPELKKGIKEGFQQDLQKAKQEVQKATEQLQQSSKGMDQVLSSPTLRPALRGGMEEAAKDLEAFEQLCLSWGAEAGELQRVPAEEKMALMKHILESPKLRQLAMMIGRLKRLALSKRSTRITMVPEEVVDITQGNDLSRVLPSELLLLGDPDRELLFYEKFIGRKLLEYELRGKEKLAKGPIICCIDNSGSMSGERELWSKAVALALAEIARRDKRHFYVIHFGSSTDPMKTFHVHYDARGKERLEALIEIATYFLGGGTDFERPLDRAAALCVTVPKADIVFITDGGAELSPAFQKAYLEVKRKHEFRVFSVIILGTEETLEDVSDETHHLFDLVRQGDGVAAKIFEGV